MDAARPPSADVRRAVAAAALLLAEQVAARATRDALFLSAFPVSALPVMTAAAAALSLAATFAMSRLLAARSPARVLPLALAASAVAFLGEWGLALTVPRVAAVALYLHQAVLGAVLLSGFWLLVTERFDPHAARHSMGRIGAGASLGGVAGGAFTWAAAETLRPATMLAVLAAASVAGILGVRALGAGARDGARGGESTAARAAIRTAARSPLVLIWRAPLLRALAGLVVITAVLDVVLDYVLAAAATGRFGDGPALMSFFALFHAATGLLSLLGQVAVAGPLLARLGPAWTLASSPLAAALGAAAALFAPGFTAAVSLRGGYALLRNSAFRSGYELFYTPVPDAQKRSAKVVVDVAGDRVGGIVGSGAVMLVLWLAGERSPQVLLGVALAAAVAAFALTPRLRHGYVSALAGSLRAASAPLDGQSIVEPATLLTLASVQARGLSSLREAASSPEAAEDPLLQSIADLRSGDARRVARVLMERDMDARLVAHVIPLLARDSLFEAAATALRRAALRCTGQLVDALLDPSLDAAVRRRVARVLRGVPTQRSADGLLLGLDDPRFDLRYRCAQALLRVRTQNPGVQLPAARVIERAARDAAQAGQSPRHLEHCFTLLGLVQDHGPLEAAYQAIQGSDLSARGTALEYLDHVLPAAVRDRLWPHLGAARPAPSGRSADEIREDLLRSTTMQRPPSTD